MIDSNKPKPMGPWATTDSLKNAGDTADTPKSTFDTTFDAWRQDPKPQNAGPLLQALAPDIDKALKNYGGRDAEEYRTQAQLIALQMAETYDPKKGASARTHINNGLHKLTQIRQERTAAMHIPDNVHREKDRLRQITDEFVAEFDREPNLQELADKSGLSIGQLQRINQYQETKTESVFESEKGDPGTQQRSTKDMWLDYVYFELDPIDKKVYEWSTGYKGSQKLSKGEIAQRLKISGPAVSKRINKILKKIEEGEELNG